MLFPTTLCYLSDSSGVGGSPLSAGGPKETLLHGFWTLQMAQDLQRPSGVDCSQRPAKTVSQGQHVRGEVPVGQLDMLQVGLIKALSLEHLRTYIC